MKAREAAEAKAKEESASPSTDINPVALHATPALFAAPKKRHNNPVHKTKQLGIAGLFGDENEVYLYDSLIAKPVPLVLLLLRPSDPKMKTFPLGSLLRMNLKLEARFVLPHRHLPKRGMIKFLPCLVLLTTRVNLIVLKSSLLILTAGSL